VCVCVCVCVCARAYAGVCSKQQRLKSLQSEQLFEWQEGSVQSKKRMATLARAMSGVWHARFASRTPACTTRRKHELVCFASVHVPDPASHHSWGVAWRGGQFFIIATATNHATATATDDSNVSDTRSLTQHLSNQSHPRERKQCAASSLALALDAEASRQCRR
jgi:hypothetical protein